MVCRSSSYCLLSTKGERKSVEGTLKLTERKEPLYQERHAIIQDYFFEESPPLPPPPNLLLLSCKQCKSFSQRDILSSLMVCSSSSYCLLSTMGDRNQWIVLKDWQNGKNSLIKKDTQPFKIIYMNDSFPILQVIYDNVPGESFSQFITSFKLGSKHGHIYFILL